MFNKIKVFILSHKIISIIIIIVLIVGLYFIIKNRSAEDTLYITESVVKGDITTYVSETGQVEASDSINIEAKSSGLITYVGVKEGQEVKKGTLIASVDARSAKRALDNAKIDYEQLVSPDSLSVLKSENSLDESYDSGWNTVASFMSGMVDAEDDLSSIFDKGGYLGPEKLSKLNSSGKDKVDVAEDSYYKAKNSLEDLIKTYKTLSRTSENTDIEKLISSSYETSKLMANATKDSQSAINYAITYFEEESVSDATTAQSDISSLVSKANGFVNDLLSAKNNIIENTQSLEETINPADELEIKSAKLNLQSKQDDYDDCFIYAPFDGIISSLTAKVGESSGSNIGTIITKQKVAIISLNEVDIASVKIGQKSELTFDAIEGLTIFGKVVEIDSVGTVSSGVVTYGVKIVFDSDDSRVKPGMSVNASITTNEKKDILTVSSASVKTKNGQTYVEMFEIPSTNSDNKNGVVATSKVIKQEIETGISDDTLTEIISGLEEGDQIITKTTAGTTNTGSSSSTSSSSKDTTKASNSLGGGMGGGPMGGSAMGSMMR